MSKYLDEKGLKKLIERMKIPKDGGFTYNASLTFDNYEEMKKSVDLKEGMLVQTLGYYDIGDGGGAKYLIQNSNLFDKNANITDSFFLSGSGWVANGTHIITDYIPVKPNTKYTYKGIKSVTVGNSAFYDADKKYINKFQQATKINTITTPDNCYYIRMTVPKKDIVRFYFVEGEHIGNYVSVADKLISNEKLSAKIMVENDRVSMVQIGYKPNDYTQDCHDSIQKYVDLCNIDDRRYELFFPSGKWYFSETNIHNDRRGVTLIGVSPQGSDIYSTSIYPFNNNQEYIWNFGIEPLATELTGGNIVKNFFITCGFNEDDRSAKAFCKTGILISNCSYSYFDGLYFSYCRGSGLTYELGWENYFGYLNFRGCGYIDKDFNYPAFWIKRRDDGQSFASGISACYFDYFNFEGATGTCIYCEPGTNFTHCEINDIQVEWTECNLTNKYKHWSDDVTNTYLGVGDAAIAWDDDSDNIEHTYIIKGICSNIIVHNITASWTYAYCRKIEYTDENGELVTRYIRRSGILGTEERYYPNNQYGLGITVNNVIGIGDPEFALFHQISDSGKTGTAVVITQLKGCKPFQSKQIGKNNIRISNVQDKVNDYASSHNMLDCDSYKIYAVSSIGVRYDKDSVNMYKRCFYSGEVSFSVNGRKKLRFRLFLNYDNADDLPDNLRFQATCTYNDGSESGLFDIVRIYKTDVQNGKYPLKEWFYYDINGMSTVPFGDCILNVRFKPNLFPEGYIDCLEESCNNRTCTASMLTGRGFSNSEPGAVIYCTDRRKSADDDLGIMLVFDGTNWKTFDGVLASSLVA